MGARQIWSEVIKKHTDRMEDGWWVTQKNIVMEISTAVENVHYGEAGPPTFNAAKAILDSDDFLVLYRPSGGLFDSRTATTSYIPWGQIKSVRFREY